MRRLSLVAIVITSLSASPALAQRDGFRLGGYLLTGFAGDAELDTNFIDVSADLEPSIGFGIRGEAAVFEYLSLGGHFELNSFEADAGWVSTDREPAVTFDVWVRGRYPIEIEEGLKIEPYVGLPLGFSLLIIDSSSGSGDDALPGWNIGLLFGLYLVTDVNVGAFFELGWRYHQWFHEDQDWNVGGHQLALNLGASYLF